MSCMSARLTRMGGGKVSLKRVSGDTTINLGRNDDIIVSFDKVGWMSCSLNLVCSTGVVIHYLEIEPTMIWVYPDFEVDNNVYSNTLWNVN